MTSKLLIQITFMAISGMCLGSFCHVLVFRDDWHTGRSRCDHCGNTLKWFDMIPVFSYLALKGRCRYCRNKIGIEHLAAEMFLGCGLAALAPYFFKDALTAVILLATVIFLGIFAISDTLSGEIAVIYLYGGILCIGTLKAAKLLHGGNIKELLIFVGATAVFYVLCCLLAKLSRGKIGDGDFDILLLLLMVCGIFDTITCITLASVIGTCLYLPLILSGRYNRNTPLPLAPLLYTAFIINLVFRNLL